MKAIVSKYISATQTKPSRVVATAEPHHRVTIGYHSAENPFQAAAVALCRKMSWHGTLIEGGMPDGHSRCYVFASNYSTKVRVR